MRGRISPTGYALESEVGLFAMKREQAYRQLAPFEEADIQVRSRPARSEIRVVQRRSPTTGCDERLESENSTPNEPAAVEP